MTVFIMQKKTKNYISIIISLLIVILCIAIYTGMPYYYVHACIYAYDL